MHDLFRYFKICYVKKIIVVSKEDTNQFLISEKFKSTSKKDADLFFIKKNLDLHPRKMQIRF